MFFRSMLFFLCIVNTFSVLAAEQRTVSVAVGSQHQNFLQASPSYRLSWSLFETAAADCTLNIELHDTSWTASIRRLQSGKLDILFGALYDEERAKWAQFSVPFWREVSVLFGPLNGPEVSLAEINRSKAIVGVVANSTQSRIATDMGFRSVYEAQDQHQLFSMLQAMHVDYMIFGRTLSQYYCAVDQRQQGCMRSIAEVGDPSYSHFISRKDDQAMQPVMQCLNQALITYANTEKAHQDFMLEGFDDETFENWRNMLSVQASEQTGSDQ